MVSSPSVRRLLEKLLVSEARRSGGSMTASIAGMDGLSGKSKSRSSIAHAMRAVGVAEVEGRNLEMRCHLGAVADPTRCDHSHNLSLYPSKYKCQRKQIVCSFVNFFTAVSPLRGRGRAGSQVRRLHASPQQTPRIAAILHPLNQSSCALSFLRSHFRCRLTQCPNGWNPASLLLLNMYIYL